MPKSNRLFRREKAEYFPRLGIVAVLDGPRNVVHFNDTYSGDRTLENRAMFMDQQIMDLPPNYLPR